MATAGIIVFLLFLCIPAPLATMAAAVVDEEGENNQQREDESNGREAGEDQESLWKKRMGNELEEKPFTY